MDLSKILGRSKTSFYHAKSPLQLPTKSGTDVSISDFCRNTIPSCQLNPLLFNGHLQTCWTAARLTDVPVYYKRKIFEAEDPRYAGSFVVDFVAEPFDEKDDSLPARTAYFSEEEMNNIGSLDSKPMLVALHGLSGGSYELYVRHVLAPLTAKDTEWEACVLTARGCAQSKITTGILFNARATWDVRQFIKWLRKTYPNRPLFGIGFSLGANILTNYVGEEGSDCELKAAVVCSNPWNLEVSSLALQRNLLGLRVYSTVMGGNMKNLVFSHEEQVSKNSKVNLDEVRKVKYLHEFDRVVQAPTWGYPTATAYYRDASSTDSMLAVRIPFLSINAEDDPISVREAIPFDEFQQNPYAVLCTTSSGGHLGWFETGGGRWFAKAAVAFLTKAAQEIDFEAVRKGAVEPVADGTVPDEGPVYDPMRRRLYYPD